MIGASLDAKVQLFCEGELYDFVKSVEDELAEVFIVSQIEVSNSSEGEFTGEEVPELSVTVSHAEGEKCPLLEFQPHGGERSCTSGCCEHCAEALR